MEDVVAANVDRCVRREWRTDSDQEAVAWDQLVMREINRPESLFSEVLTIEVNVLAPEILRSDVVAKVHVEDFVVEATNSGVAIVHSPFVGEADQMVEGFHCSDTTGNSGGMY